MSGSDDELLLPSGWYVLVKRFSAKEERRRVVAALYDPARIAATAIAFDNKLNVLHRENAGLPEKSAKGLAVFSSTALRSMPTSANSAATPKSTPPICVRCTFRRPMTSNG